MPCHMVFDMNMGFTRKDLYVAIGCNAPKSYDISYSVVVSHKNVYIAFTYVSLNGIVIVEAGLIALCSENY